MSSSATSLLDRLRRHLPVLTRLTAAVVALALWGPIATGPAVAEADAMPFGQGMLWKIEKAGAPTSYLLGTMHIADPRVVNLPAEANAALAASGQAIFELILDPSVRTQMAQAMVLSQGRTLETILGPELFQRSVEVAAEYGLPGQAIMVMKPWALVPIFSFPPEQLALLASGHAPLDERLQREAVRLGKELVGLETADEQLRLFDDAPEDVQVLMLKSVVEDRDRLRAQFDAMLADYLARDLAGLYREMLAQATAEEAGLMDHFEQDFVIARNHRMAERLRPYLARTGSFVAVGALHLPGAQGILALLAGDGYSVSRVY